MKSKDGSIIEVLYEEYLEGNETMGTKFDADLKRVSETIDSKLESGKLTTLDLADYEEAAAHAAFYAGYRAAVMAITNI